MEKLILKELQEIKELLRIIASNTEPNMNYSDFISSISSVSSTKILDKTE